MAKTVPTRVRLVPERGWRRPAAWVNWTTYSDGRRPDPEHAIHVRRWVLALPRARLAVTAHEVADIMDPDREAREREHAGHGCGASDEGGLFSLEHIPPEAVAYARQLLARGHAAIPLPKPEP